MSETITSARFPGTVRLLLLPVALILVLLAFVGRADAGAWGEPVTVSELAQTSEHVQLGSDAAGDQVAVWQRLVGGSMYVVQAAVRPARGDWTAPVELSGPAEGEPKPAVAVNATGEAIVGWTQGSGSSSSIEVIRGDVSGGWGTTRTISSPGSEVSGVAVDLDAGGDGAAAWREDLGGGSYESVVRTEEGGSWGSPQSASAINGSNEPPLLAVDPAGDAVVLTAHEGGIEAVWRPVNGSWVLTTLNVSAPPIRRPRLVISSNGEAMAIWQGKLGSTGQVEAARMVPNGTWSYGEPLPVTNTLVSEPSVAIDATGKATAVWVNEEFGGAWGIESATQSPGHPWVAAPTLPVPIESYEPQIKLRPSGGATVIWSPWRGSAHHYALAAAEIAADGSWGPELDLGEAGEEIYYPVFTTDAAGGVTVAWENEGASENLIRSVSIDPPAPPTPEPPGPEPPAPSPGGGSTEPSTSGASSSADTAAPTQNLCTAPPGAVAAGPYVPVVTRPGKTVPGVRARITVPTPSQVSVTATFEYKDGGKARTVDGGSYSMSVGSKRNLRVALPSALRSSMPLGSMVRVSLRIVATPSDSSPCAAPTTKTAKLKLKVVKVLADQVS